jgi:uncharacterized protein
MIAVIVSGCQKALDHFEGHIMVASDWLLEKVIAFSEQCYANSDNIHGLLHARTTAQYAEMLAKEEAVEENLCAVAAWLHDIGRNKWYKEHTPTTNHGVDGAKQAEQFLLSISVDQARVNQICNAISKHCFPFMQETTIEKILWDADKLNLFTNVMEKEYLRYWMNSGLTMGEARKQIRKEQEQYLKSFHTKTAVEIAHDYLAVSDES